MSQKNLLGRFAFIIALLTIGSSGVCQTPTPRQVAPTRGNEVGVTTSTSVIKDSQVKEIVQSIERKLTTVQCYRCKMETRPLDPNGGFNHLQGELAFRRPNKMLTKSKILSAHNRDQINSEIETVFDGAWEWRRIQRSPLTAEEKKQLEFLLNDESNKKLSEQERDKLKADMIAFRQKPSYSKTNFAQVARKGFSIREYLAGNGNLLDPFALYKMETLKLLRETPAQWVFVAELTRPVFCKTVRITVDKKSCFLKKIDIDVEDLGAVVVLLDVKEVTPVPNLPDSLFKMDVPPSAYVLDNTDMILMDLEAASEHGEEEALSRREPGD